MTREDSSLTRAEQFGAYVLAAARAAGYDVDSPRGGGKKALAEASGMSHASVSRMLAGRTIPDPSFFEPLAHALGVRVGKLLVRSGLVSHDVTDPEESPTRPPSLREMAADLGIRDPERVKLFEAMVRTLQDDASHSTSTRNGKVA